MAQPKFDYQGALDAGYSEEEITNFLQSQPTYRPTNQKGSFLTNISNNMANFIGNLGKPTGGQQEEPSPQSLINQKLLKHAPNFDIEGAIQAGYSPEEINDFLEQQAPQKSPLEKAGRIGAQYGLGILQGGPLMAYEGATMAQASPEAQNVAYRQNIMEDIERLSEQKQTGVWDQQDEDLLNNLVEQMKNPQESAKYAQTADIGIRGLAEKVTGLDLEPEGFLEKAANWAGFIKDPKNIKNLFTLGITPKTLTKAILPGPTETIRGLSAGAALQMAEEGNFGPMGTIAAAVVADVAGHAPKGLYHVVTHPKKTIAQVTNLLSGANSKKEWIKQIVEDADKAGITLDAGTLTDNNIIRWAQARAAQSALTGDALDNFRKNLSGQIINQYEKIANELGTLAYENNHQASEAIRNFVQKERVSIEGKPFTEERVSFQTPYTKEEIKGARPLAGRIAVEEPHPYQQELLNRISPQEFRSSYQAGETLKTAAEDIKTPIKEEFNRRWDILNREVEALPAEPHPELARVVGNFIEEQQGSLLLGESSAENRVLQSAIRLRNALMTEDGALIGVTLRDLIKTKRTLGDVANWEFGGSNFQSAYKQLVGELDRAVERTLGEVNPALRGAYEELNAEYSMFKDTFENKNVMPLFEPKNQNYNTIYNGFLQSPDKLRSLEDMMFNNPRGQQVLNQVKRDYAQRILERPNLTARDFRDLESVLGPQYQEAIQDYIVARQHAMEYPLPRAARQPTLGARVEIPAAREGKPVTGKGVPSPKHERVKLFEYISKKDSTQIMKMMDTVEGIHKLKRALSLTPEGKDLFNKLARYKLFELIDRQMMDSLGENLRVGKFSGLLKGKNTEAVVRELIGPEAFTQLHLLQKNAARLQTSLDKFYNYSKSGSTLADVGSATSLLTGIITGNPYLISISAANIGGMYVGARLLADPKFLQYLKEAALTNNKEKFLEIMQKMKPSVERAVVKAHLDAMEER